MRVQRRDDEREAGPREREREPAQPGDSLAEERPGQQRRPKRHGVSEHGGLSGAADRDRDRLQQRPARRLEQTEDQRRHERRRPQRTSCRGEQREEDQRRYRKPRAGDDVRRRIARRNLDPDPRIPPHQGQHDQREIYECSTPSLAHRAARLFIPVSSTAIEAAGLPTTSRRNRAP
jgi:hypothetical protein